MPNAELGDVTLNYREHGEGPPVLGIMGFASDQRLWAAQIPAVTRTHRFITFDNRGVGRSSKSVASTMDQFADDAVRLLDHLGIDKTVVFGISMGGAIAQRLVLDHPDRVSALILAMTFARPIEFMRRQHDLTRILVNAAGPDALLQGSLIRMFTPRFFEMGREVIDRIVLSFAATNGPEMPQTEVILGQLDALDKHDTLGDLHRVSVPTLVLGAKNDQMVPFLGSEEIAATIPGAEFVAFETGHGAPVEEMEAFNSAVSGFLARVTAGS
ncbi:MAG: alpha/beta hydrolase [Actinomycetota bacterium]|nr:alpha/beta hydrolase [Actinomycetota bacterium]